MIQNLLIIILFSIFSSDIENTVSFNKNHDFYFPQATYYNATKNQCDSTPFITANGTRINKLKIKNNRYVAISRDMLKPTEYHSPESGYNKDGPFEFGDIIIVKNSGIFDGEWQIIDTMAKRHKNRIDFLINEKNIEFDSHKVIKIMKKV